MLRNLLRFTKRSVRQGLWPLLQRYVVLRKILSLPPAKLDTESSFCVHVLLCERDVIMFHWMLRSLLTVWRGPFQVMVHDDGSLTKKSIAAINASFPGVDVVEKREAATRMAEALNGHAELLEWWRASHWAQKALDVYMLGNSRYMVLLDADLLFLGNPSELFTEESTSVWMRDSSYMLDIEPQESVARFGGHPLPALNAGLGRIERSRFRLDLAEKLLRHLRTPSNDMVFHALMTAQKSDFRLLPTTYDCSLECGLKGVIARHYTNPVRFWYYEEGVPRVAKRLGLRLHPWMRERI